jgi:hypothetical protein
VSATSGTPCPSRVWSSPLSLREPRCTRSRRHVVVRHGVSIPLLDLGAALGLARAPARTPAPRSSSAMPAAPGRWWPGPSTGWRARPSWS